MRTKRFLVALLAATLVLTLVPTAFASEGDITYTPDAGITAYPSELADEVYIARPTATLTEITAQAWTNAAASGLQLEHTTITDSEVMVSFDFKREPDSAVLLKPVMAGMTTGTTIRNRYPTSVVVDEDGDLYIGADNTVASGTPVMKLEASKWYEFNLKYTMSKHSSNSSYAVYVEVYVDGVKVGSAKSAYDSLFAGGVRGYIVRSLAIKPDGSTAVYTDTETMYKNLVVTNVILSQEELKFNVEKSIPEEGSIVPVDSTFSVVMNQAVKNAASVSDAIWLTQKNGPNVNFAKIENTTTVVEKDTLTGTLGENLFYSEEYTLSQSKSLINDAGRRLSTKNIKFTTESMFPVTAEVTDYTKSTGTASASLSFSGNATDMKVVMAAYNTDGAMVDYDVKDVQAYGNSTSLEISYFNDETIKIFAVDGFGSANLLMEPIIDGGKAKSYKQANTTISFSDVTKANSVISVEGSTDSVRGWVVTKISEKGKMDSDNILDYLSFDAVQADDDGSFKFAGKVKKTEGKYTYKAIAADSKNSDDGEIEYLIGTGNDIISLKLEGKSCRRDGNAFYLKLKNKDVGGLLVEFELPYKAVLIVDGEEVISGTSRINCETEKVLTVRSELGEEQKYELIVEVERTDDTDGRNDNLTVITNVKVNGEGEGFVETGEYIDEVEVFTDVKKGYWAEEAIEALYEMGVVGGKGDGTFDPNKLITREEFASMVAKAFNFTKKDVRMGFDDVPYGAWYEDSVYALADNDIVSGIERHVFGVGKTITRQDMTVILHRVIMNRSMENVREYKIFKDQNMISDYAKAAVEAMYKAGYVNGFEDGTFKPFEGTTKAMAAYMIYSILN